MAGNALLNAHQILQLAGVEPGMCVLECGAGHTGHLLFPAADKVGAEGAVIGVSVLPHDMHMMETHPTYGRHDHLRMVRGDYFKRGGVPLQDGVADRVFLVNQLYSIQDLDGILQEIGRLLHPMGELWVIDWREDSRHPVAPSSHLRVRPLAFERELAKRGISTKPHSIGADHFAIRAQFS